MVAQVAGKLRGQIERFSGELSTGLGKIATRFVGEMVLGILSRGSVRLTEVARALDESIPLKKTHARLDRNLAKRTTAEAIAARVLELGAMRVKADTLLIVDGSDLIKRYARSMEFLAPVRDASANEIGVGYHLCEVVAAEVGSSEIVPLVQTLWSQNADDFRSENEEILGAVRGVLEATQKRGILVVDRGGDRRKLYREWVPDPEVDFIIRLRGDRHLLFRGRACAAAELAAGCRTPYTEIVVKEEKGKERAHEIEFGYRPVRLPDHPERLLWLVVAKGFGKEPLMLLTTRRMSRNRKRLWWIVNAYITRWRVEETIRFIKQCYQLEDIRLLTYDRLRNMTAFVLAAAFFTAVRLGLQTRLRILATHALNAAKRLFGIPDFRYYALADGIRDVLSRSRRRKRPAPGSHPPEPLQLALDPP